MSTRARLALTTAALVVGAVTSACGGGSDSAPTDASEKAFCGTQTSLFKDLLPSDMSDPELPSDEEMAKAVQRWGAKLEEVGTPEDIPADARAGFEEVVARTKEVDPSDFDIEKFEELAQGGADASAAAKKDALAFSDYLTKTCGNPMDDLDLPQLPGLTPSTE